MKRNAYMLLALVAGLLISTAGAQSTSLGDYARTARKSPRPASTKVYDNDNLPRSETLSVVGKAAEESADQNASNNDKADKPTDSKPIDDKNKTNDEWKTKLAGQKAKVDLASRELDVAQREYRLRAAAFYSDAGNRLRNAGAWDREDAEYKKSIEQKQRAVDDAKKQLDDMQEQARKAGVPPGLRQ